MPTDSVIRPDLLSPGVPAFVVVLLPVVLAGAWVAAHSATRRWLTSVNARAAHLAGFVARSALGSLTLWALWQAISRFGILLETSWPLWVNSVIGACALELIFVLYQWERRIVTRAMGRILLALRIVSLFGVLVILTQPVRAWVQHRKIERRVVVLVDGSGSMQLVDHQMTATEKLDLARFRGAPATQNRPAWAALEAEARTLEAALAREAEAWNASQGAEVDGSVFVARRSGALNALADASAALRDLAASTLDAARDRSTPIDEAGLRSMNEVRAWLCEQLPNAVQLARAELAQARLEPAGGRLKVAADVLRQAVDALPPMVLAADEGYLAKRTGAERQAIDQAALVPRATVARDVLTRPDATGSSLLDQLKSVYDVTVMRFGRKAAEVANLEAPAATTDADFQMRTDITAALEQAIERVPAESLAGVLLLSDGRHNGEKPPDDAARSLGLTGAPIHAVAIGSSKGPKDAAFLKVEVAESIFLGDRIKVRAEVKADGMKGSQLKVALRQGETEVDAQTVPVPEETFRTSLRFGYAPPAKGIFSYSLKIEPVEGEVFATNNQWDFETAVTDDRTNVLLVDSVPRWEFRYLRNLFYGRDKSVHLQYVLLKPDEIQGQAPVPPIFASATRKFGDAMATRLPEKFDEWMRFDVIIIGDVAPASLPTQTWETIEKAVGERGAMLVVIAGPRSMPHAFSSEVVKRLLPIDYAPQPGPLFSGPEPAFGLRLTSEGRNSPIMSQSPSQIENARIWSETPALMWRHPIKGVKPGAEVLAYAEPAGRRSAGDAATAEERLNAFAQQKKFEAEHALLVTSRFGLGKVAMFTFDQTWRLRYGIGDTYHHRLWGNLLRWGTGENLRAGTETVRLGTDKLAYESGDRVKVLARLTADGFRPETKADVTAVVTNAAGQVVAKRTLAYRDGSSGIYEAELEPLDTTGRYTVELAGNDVDNLLRGTTTTKVQTHFTQLATLNPVELGDLALDADLLRRITSLSAGRVVTPAEAGSLAKAFGAESKTIDERRESTLWDTWPLLALALGSLTAEWLLRRKASLA